MEFLKTPEAGVVDGYKHAGLEKLLSRESIGWKKATTCLGYPAEKQQSLHKGMPVVRAEADAVSGFVGGGGEGRWDVVVLFVEVPEAVVVDVGADVHVTEAEGGAAEDAVGAVAAVDGGLESFGSGRHRLSDGDGRRRAGCAGFGRCMMVSAGLLFTGDRAKILFCYGEHGPSFTGGWFTRAGANA